MDQRITVQGAQLVEVAQTAMEYAAKSRSVSTVKAYQNDWQDFTAWCAEQALQAMPASPETLALYLTAKVDAVKVSTLERRLGAISQAHKAAGHSPVSTRLEPLHSVWQGIKRTKGTVQHGKAPARTDDIRAMVDTLPNSLLGIRDRALLLIGFAGAFRRSELVALDVDHVQVTKEGLVITLERSKTDQEGQGRKVGIPYGSNPATCPVRALHAWLGASGIKDGALFRSVNRHGQLHDGRLSDKAVALVVKRCADAAGLDASMYSGHSLRSGLATSAAAAGVSERAIMAQTGHKSVNMVRRYIREGSLFRENAAAGVGL
ncbi:MAG TPA: site-specific integrase [Symbiobacteriaceae bacterium]|nr:site-specific integrase [Symbiobacteriaceae bacterium]